MTDSCSGDRKDAWNSWTAEGQWAEGNRRKIKNCQVLARRKHQKNVGSSKGACESEMGAWLRYRDVRTQFFLLKPLLTSSLF